MKFIVYFKIQSIFQKMVLSKGVFIKRGKLKVFHYIESIDITDFDTFKRNSTRNSQNKNKWLVLRHINLLNTSGATSNSPNANAKHK